MLSGNIGHWSILGLETADGRPSISSLRPLGVLGIEEAEGRTRVKEYVVCNLGFFSF